MSEETPFTSKITLTFRDPLSQEFFSGLITDQIDELRTTLADAFNSNINGPPKNPIVGIAATDGARVAAVAYNHNSSNSLIHAKCLKSDTPSFPTDSSSWFSNTQSVLLDANIARATLLQHAHHGYMRAENNEAGFTVRQTGKNTVEVNIIDAIEADAPLTQLCNTKSEKNGLTPS